MNGKTMTALSIVTIGGAPIGMSGGFSRMLVTCPACDGCYQMDNDPAAFGLSPVGATVLDGYVEHCHICGALHFARAVLEIGGMV